MRQVRAILIIISMLGILLGPAQSAVAEQIWTKCHVTCRCLQDNTVGNFAFVIPIDKSPDVGFEADLACKAYGNRVCSDGCNGIKFNYSYQVTSP
jgi:hypothetical protein